jgi:hypothetical protein
MSLLTLFQLNLESGAPAPSPVFGGRLNFGARTSQGTKIDRSAMSMRAGRAARSRRR